MSQEPASLLHVLAPARYGGLETVVVNLAREQHRRGHAVYVGLVVPTGSDPEHPVAAALADSGATPLMIEVEPRHYGTERTAIGKILERRQPAVLHTHGLRVDMIDGPVAARTGTPWVSTVHGYSGVGIRGSLTDWLHKQRIGRADAIIAVSDTVGRHLIAHGVPESKIHSVPNAWRPPELAIPRAEAQAIVGVADSGPTVGWVGRISKEKGPDVMVSALTHAEPEVRLSMVGDGPMLTVCQRQATRQGVASRIQWHGAIERIGPLLKAFDVLALTSWTEGTPMVLLEAMALEVPIVATAVGGVPAMLSDEDAILVEAGDTKAIGRAITEALRTPRLTKQRAESARHRLISEFSVERWVDRHSEIYHSLTKR